MCTQRCVSAQRNRAGASLAGVRKPHPRRAPGSGEGPPRGAKPPKPLGTSRLSAVALCYGCDRPPRPPWQMRRTWRPSAAPRQRRSEAAGRAKARPIAPPGKSLQCRRCGPKVKFPSPKTWRRKPPRLARARLQSNSKSQKRKAQAKGRAGQAPQRTESCRTERAQGTCRRRSPAVQAQYMLLHIKLFRNVPFLRRPACRPLPQAVAAKQ